MAQGATDHVCGLYHASTAIAQTRCVAAPEPSAVLGNADSQQARKVARGAARLDPDLLDDPLHKGSISGLSCWQDKARPGLLEGGGETQVVLRYCGPDLPGLKACFLMRDRLAQIVFGASAPLCHSAENKQPEARFVFDLPFLVSAEYVVEALVINTLADGTLRLIDRAAPMPLEIRTTHISHGLANLRMRAITIKPVPNRFSEAG